MSTTILVAVRDPESAASAIQRARSLCRPGDRLCIAHVGRAEEDEERSGDALFKDIDVETPDGVTSEVFLLRGRPATEVTALAERLDAVVVVVATPRRALLREFAIGSTAVRILNRSRRPVLVVRTDGATAYRRVVAAVDVDVSASRVIRTTQMLFPDAELTLLHAYRLTREGGLRVQGVSEAEIADLRTAAERSATVALEALREHAPGARLEVREGYAASVILNYALQEHPDLVALSRHRGSAFEEFTLGSVTQFSIYNCPSDLLMVP